jgi:hypothetical protein
MARQQTTSYQVNLCLGSISTALFGSHYLPKSTYYDKKSTCENNTPEKLKTIASDTRTNEQDQNPMEILMTSANQVAPTPIKVTPLKCQVPLKMAISTPQLTKKLKKATLKTPPPVNNKRHAINPYTTITMNSNAPQSFSKPITLKYEKLKHVQLLTQ